MLHPELLLVTVMKLVDRIPEAEALKKGKRECPKVYPDRLIVKALIIMVIRRLFPSKV